MNYRVDLIETIKSDEGLRLMPYKCSEGFLTIGYGRNIEHNGIREDEAEYMLVNDIKTAEQSAKSLINDFDGLSDARKIVLVSMVFQMGYTGVSKFKNMIAAINKKDFFTAGKEMLNSRWAKQTPARAKRLARQMATDELLN